MKISNAALLLFSGFTLGAVTGLLLAPDEGARTRKKMAKKAKKYKRALEEKPGEIKDKAYEIRDNIEGAAGDIKKRFS
jgi:gas vesicle protein